MLCSILTSQEVQNQPSQDVLTIRSNTSTQEVTYRELHEVWQEIHFLYNKIASFQYTKEEEQRFIQLLYKYLDVISIHQSSELYTFMQIHDFPNYENLSFLEQNVEKLLQATQDFTENHQLSSLHDLDKLFIQVQDDYINYTYHNTQEFNDSSFMLSLIFIVFVVSSIVIIFISLLYAHSIREKTLLKTKIQEKETITNVIVQVQEDERERISRDIHDTVLQDMRVEQFYLDRLQPLIYPSTPSPVQLEKIQELFESILSLKKTSLKNITSIVRNLVPLEITSEKYKQTLNDLVNKFTKDWGISCSFYAPTDILLEKLSDTHKIHIYRIIQEAMTNAAKHAKAEEIVVAVREDIKSEPNKLFFFITDDGCGIAMDKKEQNSEMSTHLGLKGMYARSQIINATLDISSDEATGTQVTLALEM
jgi:signal transduction histidine kinase